MPHRKVKQVSEETEQRQSALAAAVHEARLAKGWSKERAAGAAGISPITWKRVEDGLPVQEHKLRAVGEALGWEPGRAFRLMAEPAGAEPGTGVSDDELMAEWQEITRQIEVLAARWRRVDELLQRGSR